MRVTWWQHEPVQGQALKERRSSREESVPPPQFAYINGAAILKSDVVRTKIARLPYCRDVTVGMSLPVSRHYHAAQPNAGKKDASFFNVISAASLWDLRLWCQWGEGMWGCVRIESTCVNVFSHCTYHNALFVVFFLRCLRQMKVQRGIVQSRRLLTALLDDRARLGEDWRRGSVIWKWVKPCVYRVQPLCTGTGLYVLM